tara:strand:+ start:336 stop:1367 length:1032 start_codon:yes stop_codon:yes gene_type:complete
MKKLDLLKLPVNAIKKHPILNGMKDSKLEVLRDLEKSGLNKKGKPRSGLVKFLDAKLSKTDGRSTAKKDEDIRVFEICAEINNNTEIGRLLKQEYYIQRGIEILRVEKRGGNNIHYDILIFHPDGTTARCEEKGTKKYCEKIDETTKPYENSVEFYNGPAANFSIPNKYLKLWYDIITNNPDFNKKYNLPEPPSFEDWLIGGPYCMVDPKSDYSKTLKINYRSLYPGKSMNSWGHNNIDYREGPNKEFDITDEEKSILIEEVQNIYNDIMNQKDVWLQTTGKIDGQFSFKWFDKIEPQKIVNVELVKKKDIEFIFELEDNTSFTGIMRWGKGCGFSCFRMDFK